MAQDGGIIPAADVRTTYEGIIGAAEMMLDDAFDLRRSLSNLGEIFDQLDAIDVG